MKTPIFIVLLVAFTSCASRARHDSIGVAVYEAPATATPAERRLPEGCRLLSTSGPIDQMESERAMDDPYKRVRAEVAEKGGNVLLVLSQRTVTRPNTDCPSGDSSADCARHAQSWFHLSFEGYACSPEAAAELKKLPPPPPTGGITLLLSSPKKASPASSSADSTASRAAEPVLTPVELKKKILEMMRENVGSGVILAYVRGQRLSQKMTAEEIIDWTRAGIANAVIEAAAAH